MATLPNNLAAVSNHRRKNIILALSYLAYLLKMLHLIARGLQFLADIHNSVIRLRAKVYIQYDS